MRYRHWILLGLSLGGFILPYLTAFGATAIGFGMGAPPIVPIQWENSFPFVLIETLAEGNLSFLFTLGAYPSEIEIPDVFEVARRLESLLHTGGRVRAFPDSERRFRRSLRNVCQSLQSLCVRSLLVVARLKNRQNRPTGRLLRHAQPQKVLRALPPRPRVRRP